LLDRGIENRFSLVISEFILKETETVLRRPKFKTSEDEIQRVVLAVMQSGDMVRVESDFRAIESDPADNMILNTACDGHADFIVTGDKALLHLRGSRRSESYRCLRP
jgi:putative PIN family toxin of toxin-antitoxin system